MGRSDYYKSGDWNGECDVCGQKYKASKLRFRWDGLRVCPKDFEYRNPQDFVKGVKDNQSVPYSRPEPPDSFVPLNYTQYPIEGLQILESASANVIKTINPHTAANDGLNTFPINTFAINSGITSYIPTIDDFSVSESFLAALGRSLSESVLGITDGVAFSLIRRFAETLFTSDFTNLNDVSGKSDSIATTTESSRFSVTKIFSESSSPTENVSFSISSFNSINGSSINTTTLG